LKADASSLIRLFSGHAGMRSFVRSESLRAEWIYFVILAGLSNKKPFFHLFMVYQVTRRRALRLSLASDSISTAFIADGFRTPATGIPRNWVRNRTSIRRNETCTRGVSLTCVLKPAKAVRSCRPFQYRIRPRSSITCFASNLRSSKIAYGHLNDKLKQCNEV
jgi:hypothetical protein